MQLVNKRANAPPCGTLCQLKVSTHLHTQTRQHHTTHAKNKLHVHVFLPMLTVPSALLKCCSISSTPHFIPILKHRTGRAGLISKPAPVRVLFRVTQN